MSNIRAKNTLIEDKLGDEDVVIPFKYGMTSYGADYPVDGLVKRIQNGSALRKNEAARKYSQ
jgi:hypothetical protein